MLLAFASVFTASLTVLPNAFYRFLAFPNGIAMIGLGSSLWLSTRTATTLSAVPVDSALDTAAGAR